MVRQPFEPISVLGDLREPNLFWFASLHPKKRDTSGCRVQIKDRKERNNETYVVQEGWGGLGQDMKHHNRAGEGG